MPNTKQTGDVTEARILHELLRRGHSVSIPFGDNDPYDLVADIEARLVRVQYKTGCLEDGRVRFKTGSTTTVDGDPAVVDYGNDVDVFAVRCSDSGTLYWVPADETGQKNTYLRVEPAEIDHPAVRQASEYTLEWRLP